MRLHVERDVKETNRFKHDVFSVLLVIGCGMDLRVTYESKIKGQIKIKFKNQIKDLIDI